VTSSQPLRKFPLVPKSTRFLQPGDFWAIPLSDGTYGCGIVLELAPLTIPSGSRAFLGALSSWHGDSPPSTDALAGQRCLEQGVMHILAITQTGGAILGNRPLKADGLELWLFADGNSVKRGFTPTFSLRPLATLPSLGWWGYDVISIYAHKHLLGVTLSDR
jgi:hypothetical protein